MIRRFKFFRPHLSLTAQLSLAIGGTALALSLLVSLAIGAAVRAQMQISVGESLEELTHQMTHTLDRWVFERSGSIQVLATLSAIHDPEVPLDFKRSRIENLQEMFPDYTWIGLADREGTVLASTGGLLEGEEVAERSWFTGGLSEPYVADVHRALRLEALFGKAEPLRVIDVSIPVLDPDGNLTGVLGARLSWAWVRELESSLLELRKDHADIFVFAHGGELLFAPADVELPEAFNLATLSQAEFNGFRVERWFDGQRYLTGYAQSSGYRDFPGLGWRVLARQPTELAFASARQLQQWIFLLGLLAGLGFAGLGLFLARGIANPILKIARAADRIRQGDTTAAIPALRGSNELVLLSDALSNLVSTLKAQQEELVKANEKLKHDAFHDALTGLPNRALFMDRLTHAIHRTKRHPKLAFAVLFLDFDRFKVINDSLGHTFGDALLVRVARRLEKLLRPADTVARLGGDEFVILLEDIDSVAEAVMVAERIQQALLCAFSLEDRELHITASIGVVSSELNYERPEEVLRDADIAMYRAKALGKAGYQVFQPAMRERAKLLLTLETDLRNAISRQQLKVYYQPIVSLENQEIVGFEALVRWFHPLHKLVSPAEFIPIAEETGLIIDIDRWVLREACRQLQRWNIQHPNRPPFTINVNLSAQQFTRHDLAAYVRAVLQETAFEAPLLRLEITEGLLMNSSESVTTTIKQLQGLGVGLHIDDFGTGYSSLGYLQRFPVHALKIDRSFIASMTKDLEHSELVRTIITMARNLALAVVAEGVETAEQLAELKALRCNYAQGYLFSKPLAPADAAQLLRQAKA